MTVESNTGRRESSPSKDPFANFRDRLGSLGIAIPTPEERHRKYVGEHAAAVGAQKVFQQFTPDGPLNFEDNVKSLIEWITYAKGEIPESVDTNLQIMKEIEDTYATYVKLGDGNPVYEAQLPTLRSDLDSQKQDLVNDIFLALKEAGEAVYGAKALASNDEAQAALRETSDAKEVIGEHPELGKRFEAAVHSLDNTREVFRSRNVNSFLKKNLPTYEGWTGNGYPVGEKNFASSKEAESYFAERQRVVPQTAEFIVGTFIKRLGSNVLAESGVEDKREFFDSDIKFTTRYGVQGAPKMEKETIKKLWVEMFRMSIQERLMNSHSRTNHRQDFSIICQNLYLYSRALEGSIDINENGHSPDRIINDCPELGDIKIKDVFSTINQFDPDFFIEMCAILRVNGHEIKKEEVSSVYSFDNDLLATKEFFIDPNGIPYRKGQHDEDTSAIEKNIGEIIAVKTPEGNENKILTAKQGAEVANRLQSELLQARVEQKQGQDKISRLESLLSEYESGERVSRKSRENLSLAYEQLRVSEDDRTRLDRRVADLETLQKDTSQNLLDAQENIKSMIFDLSAMIQNADAGLFGLGEAKVPVTKLKKLLVREG